MASYTRKIVQGTVIISLLSVVIGLLGYSIRIMLARNLSVEGYGLFYAVMAFVSLFIAFKNIGMGSAIARYIPVFLAKKDLKSTKYAILSTFTIQVIFTGIIAILLIIFAPFFSTHFFHTTAATTVLIFLVLSFFFSLFQDVFSYIFTGFQKSSLMSLPELFKNTFILLLLFVFFMFNKSATIAALAYCISAFTLPFIFSLVFMKLFPSFMKIKSGFNPLSSIKSFLNFDKSDVLIRKLRNFGFFMFFNTQGELIMGYTDVLVLTFFRTLGEVGLYNAAIPLITIIMFFPSSLTSILMPTVSEIWSRNQKQLLADEIKRVQKYALIAVIPLALSLFSFSDVAIQIFFGSKYVAASLVLKVLSIGAIFNTLAVLNKEILNGIGKPWINSKIVFIALLFNLILCLIFVPHYGMIAAAISVSLGYVCILIMNSIQIRKYIKSRLPITMFCKIFLAGIVFLCVILPFRTLQMALWLKIGAALILACIIYALALFVLGIVTVDEFKLMRNRLFS